MINPMTEEEVEVTYKKLSKEEVEKIEAIVMLKKFYPAPWQKPSKREIAEWWLANQDKLYTA